MPNTSSSPQISLALEKFSKNFTPLLFINSRFFIDFPDTNMQTDAEHKPNSMQFSETLEVLEQMFEQHKLDNRDIQDFRQTVDECIARQAEVSAEDSYDYCELLKMMESEYQQLRELSAGRMIDLDSLIAFIRAAQLELLWIHQREELEVTRNWSDLERLDKPMLQNYFKQLLHEIELHEKQFNDVHNQGAALINQRHPAGEMIEVYLRSMQNNWDWLLNLSKCLEGHLRDAYNAKAFVEESEQVEQQMQQQLDHLDREYARTDFSLDEGEQMLRQLDSVREYIQQLHARLLSLTDRCAQILPLSKPEPVVALCEYKSKDKIHIRQEPDFSNQFDAACIEFVRKFEEGWKQLNHRVQERVATNLEELERQIREHKAFEDALQTLDVDMSNVKELYRQLLIPTPTQRAAHDNMVQRWQDIWGLSRMYVERLQENIVKKLNRDTAPLCQHVARTRIGSANRPDVDQIEDQVSQITVRAGTTRNRIATRWLVLFLVLVFLPTTEAMTTIEGPLCWVEQKTGMNLGGWCPAEEPPTSPTTGTTEPTAQTTTTESATQSAKTTPKSNLDVADELKLWLLIGIPAIILLSLPLLLCLCPRPRNWALNWLRRCVRKPKTVSPDSALQQAVDGGALPREFDEQLLRVDKTSDIRPVTGPDADGAEVAINLPRESKSEPIRKRRHRKKTKKARSENTQPVSSQFIGVALKCKLCGSVDHYEADCYRRNKFAILSEKK